MRKMGVLGIACVIAALLCGCGKKAEEPAVKAPGKPKAAPSAKATPGTEVRKRVMPRPSEISNEEIDKLSAEVKEKLKGQALVTRGREASPIILLGRSRNPKAVPALKEVLTSSKEPLARRQAAQALSMVRDPSAAEALKAGLKDEYMWVRLTSAISLARQGEKKLPIEVFAEVINGTGAENWKIEMSENPQSPLPEAERVKLAGTIKSQTFPLLALSGLGMINSPESLELVKTASKSENRFVRQKAEKMLSKSSGAAASSGAQTGKVSVSAGQAEKVTENAGQPEKSPGSTAEPENASVSATPKE